MRTLVIAVAAVLVALAAATGVTVIVEQSAKPDKNVNLDNARPADLWSGTDYGDRNAER